MSKTFSVKLNDDEAQALRADMRGNGFSTFGDWVRYWLEPPDGKHTAPVAPVRAPQEQEAQLVPALLRLAAEREQLDAERRTLEIQEARLEEIIEARAEAWRDYGRQELAVVLVRDRPTAIAEAEALAAELLAARWQTAAPPHVVLGQAARLLEVAAAGLPDPLPRLHLPGGQVTDSIRLRAVAELVRLTAQAVKRPVAIPDPMMPG